MTFLSSRVAEPEPKHFFVRSEPGAGARPTVTALALNVAYKNLTILKLSHDQNLYFFQVGAGAVEP